VGRAKTELWTFVQSECDGGVIFCLVGELKIELWTVQKTQPIGVALLPRIDDSQTRKYFPTPEHWIIDTLNTNLYRHNGEALS
jgi:hypothetical protein